MSALYATGHYTIKTIEDEDGKSVTLSSVPLTARQARNIIKTMLFGGIPIKKIMLNDHV